jgi:hypothetical protein
LCPLLLSSLLLLLQTSLLRLDIPLACSTVELVLLTPIILLGKLVEVLVVLAHLLHEVTVLVEWHLCLLDDQ